MQSATNQGFFFRHELTLKYDYFMMIDSDSLFHCKLNEDPFEKFRNSEMKYGFILAIPEYDLTIPTLWNTVKNWTEQFSINLKAKNLNFVSDDNGKSLNKKLCIFYSNFGIGDFSVFRNESYLQYFD